MVNGKTENQKFVDVLLEPFQRFFRIEASGGIILLISTAFALIWANSAYHETYHHFWHHTISIGIGDFLLSKTLSHWINDGLMAIFFFVVGLEIKREILAGELSTVKKASLPFFVALGGMIFPALIYIFLTEDVAEVRGWGIPMATDIAFSLGVLSLLGKRVPLSLKVFLVAFAIVDDLGAVLVIAFFYSGHINIMDLYVALALFGVLILMNLNNIRQPGLYVLIGIFIWYLFLSAGIHPTLAGVLIAFTIPAKRKIKLARFRENMDKNMLEFCTSADKRKMTLNPQQLAAIDNMEDQINYVQSPLQRLENSLHGFVTFVIMPLFAFANAGVTFIGVEGASATEPLSMHIEFSLILGKALGIFLFTYISVKMGLSAMPDNVKWVHILGLGFLGGMGFTMSLFISNLAFGHGLLLNQAKMGVLVGSLIAGVAGYIILHYSLKRGIVATEAI